MRHSIHCAYIRHERSTMKKILNRKSRLNAWVMTAALICSALPIAQLPAVHAQETPAEDAALSLDYVSSVTADIEGRVLRIYGSPGTTYRNPISVTASCTVILDQVKNDADLTIAEGREVRLILRGSNQLADIKATGGSGTLVHITGEAGGGTLNAGDIACSAGGTEQTGANVSIENCSVFCRNIGCGGDGEDLSAWEGSASIANPSPGSNASPQVTIRGANVSVSGSVACGGNGVQSTGTWAAAASSGGSSGSVDIRGSYVTVGGHVAVGGKGGPGNMGSTYYNCLAGETRSSSPVTIAENSSVNVAGNVSTQPDLPAYSNEGKQSGLHGVTVTVTDSSLSAKDIASGGAGHVRVHYSVYSGSGVGYDIFGTAGGNGGQLVARNAVISCERAVCGADAGEYQNYEVSSFGDKSGDVESAGHPMDGTGGSVQAADSFLTVRDHAAAKGARWDKYPNPSVYGDSTFTGGTLNGWVYGGVITTDVTSIIGGGFRASEIRNSEEASCAKCVLKTNAALGGASVQIRANDIGGTVMLGGDGSITTYLGIGKETVKLTGAGVYAGTFMVKRSETLNAFQLEPYGIIDVGYDGAVIRNGSYTHTNETYDYTGDFSIRGSSADAAVTVEEGVKRLTLEGTSFGTLNVAGTSVVTLVLNGVNHIPVINVDAHATLIIEGSGSLFTEQLGNSHGASGKIEINSGNVQIGVLGGDAGGSEVLIRDPSKVDVGESRVPLRDGNGSLLYPLELVLGNPGDYTLRLNEETEHVVLTEGKTSVTRLTAAGAYVLEVARGPFRFRGSVTIREAQRIYLDDLTLYVDTSSGDIFIRDGEVTVGGERMPTDAEVRITQSGDRSNQVFVEKKTASIILDGVSPDIQIDLPEDFQGIIRDADNRPIQVVTVQTGLAAKEMTLLLDKKGYGLTTNNKGNLSIIVSRGMHDFGLVIDGMTYQCRDAVSISGTEHVVRRRDMVLVWDVSLGELTVTQSGFSAGEYMCDFAGAYLIKQTDADAAAGMVTIERGDAAVFLSKEVDELLQVKIPEGFTGSILKEELPLYPLVVETNCMEAEVTVSLDGHTGVLRTDAKGRLYLVAASGTHALIVSTGEVTAILSVPVGEKGAVTAFDELLSLRLNGFEVHHSITVTVGDTTAQVETDDDGSCQILVDPATKEIIVTDGEDTFRYPVVDGTLGEPRPYDPENPDSGNTGDGNTDGSGSGGTGDGSTDGSGSGGTGDGSTGGSGSGGTGDGSTGGSGTGGTGSGSTGGTGGTGSGSTGGTGGSGSHAAGTAPAEEDENKPAAGFGNGAGLDRIILTDGFGGKRTEELRNIHQLQNKPASGEDIRDTGNAAVQKPQIIISASVKGIRLLERKQKNTYQIYSRKTVTITLQREKDTEYFYKIVKKGQRNSSVAWKALDGKRITVKAAPYGRRVFIKAVRDGMTAVKKTTGFVVDATKPTVKGVRNAGIYRDAPSVSVRDSGGIASVKLNGKKMPKHFVIEKRGIYRLVVTDRAGNKKQVIFAVV